MPFTPHILHLHTLFYLAVLNCTHLAQFIRNQVVTCYSPTPVHPLYLPDVKIMVGQGRTPLPHRPHTQCLLPTTPHDSLHARFLRFTPLPSTGPTHLTTYLITYRGRTGLDVHYRHWRLSPLEHPAVSRRTVHLAYLFTHLPPTTTDYQTTNWIHTCTALPRYPAPPFPAVTCTLHGLLRPYLV